MLTSKSGKVGYYCPNCNSRNLTLFYYGGIQEEFRLDRPNLGSKLTYGQKSIVCSDCGNFVPYKNRIKRSLRI